MARNSGEAKLTIDWDWICKSCGKRSVAPTEQAALEALKAHTIRHIEEYLEAQVAEGILDRVGQRDGKTVYAATKLGRACWDAGVKMPSQAKH